ncbi:hypothetical protein VaNZ11_005404 [Volvox africanus]|uniref:ABC transporter domain-containing protein n=1 Tax=Volvox africanus TaxID=51714 RepID=A0ABQ5RYY4_9CHLO|nr:hypothetical protein VaNZ11_005404 [Volvox africanus]
MRETLMVQSSRVLLFNILFLVIISGRVVAIPDERPCISNNNCWNGTFCTRTSFPWLTSESATCVSCWQCCLFPEVYGAESCSSHCRCRRSQSCSLDSDCGQGEFCAVVLSRSDLPVCQPCHLCRNDAQAWCGACATACPSAALDDNGVAPQLQQGVGLEVHYDDYYVFAAFDISGHPLAQAGFIEASAQSDGLVQVSEAAVRMWLADLPTYVQDALLQPATSQLLVSSPTVGGATASRIVSLRDIAARLATVAAQRDLLCPQLQSVGGTTGANSLIATTTVPEGCICNATANAATFRCPGGQRCSRRAWLPLPADVITLGGTALLKARCVACEPGSFCPEGTFVEEQDGWDFMESHQCPQGYFCPTPAQKHECPAGYFCPARSTLNLACDYVKLLLTRQVMPGTNALMTNILADSIQFLVDSRKPLRGNYCPNRSSTPTTSCRAGFFCPDPSQELTCPSGNYCRAETVKPTVCPPLTLCNAGSCSPRIWPATVAAFCGLALSVLAVGVVAASLDHSRVQNLPSKADQDKRSAAARTMRRFVSRFHGDQLTSSPRKVWVVEPRNLEVRDLRWTGPGRAADRPVLKSVTGYFFAGELSAILGPSGCGKSSLLALLAGRDSHWPLNGGEVQVNGVKIHNPGHLKYVTGFVPQDDILCTELTVQENLQYSAALRLPRLSRKTSSAGSNGSYNSSELSAQMVTSPVSYARSPTMSSGGKSTSNMANCRSNSHSSSVWSSVRGFTYSAAEERKLLVEEVLTMLDLKMLRDQRVGGINDRSLSGGQRKRVNIGVELVARPPVLLLDEPTSGLDAACSSDVLISLADMAEERLVNVIMVVHQPRRSVYKLFKTVVLLDRQGVSVYHGDARKAEAYFRSLGYPPIPSRENVPDRLLDIIAGKCYNQSGISTKELPPSSRTFSREVDESPAASPTTGFPLTPLSPAPSPQEQTWQQSPRKPNPSRTRPALTEELAGVVEEEYEIILGTGAVKRGGMLDRNGLLRLLRHLGQEGQEVEDFVQGILEETGRRRRLEQQLWMGGVSGRGGAGGVGEGEGGEFDRGAQPYTSHYGLSGRGIQQNIPRRVSKEQQQQQQQQQQQHNNVRVYSVGRSQFLPLYAAYSVTIAAQAITSKEFLAALEMVQNDQLKARDLKIRLSDLTSPRPSRPLAAGAVVTKIGETLQNAAHGFKRQLSNMLGMGARAADRASSHRIGSSRMPNVPPVGGPQQEDLPSQLSAGGEEFAKRGIVQKARTLLRNGFSLPGGRLKLRDSLTQSEDVSSQLQQADGRMHSPLPPSSPRQQLPWVAHRRSITDEINSRRSIDAADSSGCNQEKDGTKHASRNGNNSHGNNRSKYTNIKIVPPELTVGDTLSSPAHSLPASLATGRVLLPPMQQQQQESPHRAITIIRGAKNGPMQQCNKPTGEMSLITNMFFELGGGDEGQSRGPCAQFLAGQPPAKQPGGGSTLGDKSFTFAPPAVTTESGNNKVVQSNGQKQQPEPQPEPQQQQQQQQVINRESISGGHGVSPRFPAAPKSPIEEGLLPPSPFTQFNGFGDDSKYKEDNEGGQHPESFRRGNEIETACQQLGDEQQQQGAGQMAASLKPQGQDQHQVQQQQQQPGEGQCDSEWAGSLRQSSQASRKHPSWLLQLYTFTQRALLQSFRAFWPLSMLEVALLLSAAAAVGANVGTQWGPTDVPGNMIMAMLCLAVLAVVQHLRTFASNRLVLQRERGVGLSPSAYFIARSLADLPWIAVAPMFFSLPFYILTVPRTAYVHYYVTSVGVWWWASGLSYLVTVTPLMPPAAAPTAAVLLTLIGGALLNGVNSPTIAETRGSATGALLSISYNRWAVEALTISELNEYLDSHGNVITLMYRSKGLCGFDYKAPINDSATINDLLLENLWPVNGNEEVVAHNFCSHARRNALIILFCLGIGLRVMACMILKYDAKILSNTLSAWEWCCCQCESIRVHTRMCLLNPRCRTAVPIFSAAANGDGSVTTGSKGCLTNDQGTSGSSRCGSGPRKTSLECNQITAATGAPAAVITVAAAAPAAAVAVASQRLTECGSGGRSRTDMLPDGNWHLRSISRIDEGDGDYPEPSTRGSLPPPGERLTGIWRTFRKGSRKPC